MRRISLLPSVLIVATIVVLLSVFGIVRQNVRQMQVLRDQTSLVEHTLEVQSQLDNLLLQTTQAESAVRGYLLTGTEEGLGEFTEAKEELAGSLDRLASLTRDSQSQSPRVLRLRELIQARLARFEQTIQARRQSGVGVQQ